MAERFAHPDTPFPIGVEYYRGGAPKPECWDEDFANIRAAGFRIVRSASYWNWMEPARDTYHLDDYDAMFDLAAKHGLSMWLDVMLATHGAAPEWMTRDYPDFRVVNYRGHTFHSNSHPAYPQGGMIHCYDHPIWRERGGKLLQHVVGRYHDHPAAFVWGIWDGIALSSQWADQHDGYPCYCEHSIARYWPGSRPTSRWKSSTRGPPAATADGRTSSRHVPTTTFSKCCCSSASTMRISPDTCDGWSERSARSTGYTRPERMAHGSLVPGMRRALATPTPGACRCPRTTCSPAKTPTRSPTAHSRSSGRGAIGKGGRWWNEEIYSGMSPGGVTWKKQTDPRELTTLLWMTLAHGAAGAMFWQYRPDHVAFESPGYNLAALDGRPTSRLEAVSEAIALIDGLAEHLPLRVPTAKVAIVNHQPSHDLFTMNGEGDRFLADLRGTYRTLWTNGVPVDIVTPSHDWASYDLVILSNVALMTGEVRDRIARTLADSPTVRLIASGSFGMYSDSGLSSYDPPEGLGTTFGVRVADFSSVTDIDISQGRATVDPIWRPVLPVASWIRHPGPTARNRCHRVDRRADRRRSDGRWQMADAHGTGSACPRDSATWSARTFCLESCRNSASRPRSQWMETV